jgi:NosR/NirI family nitrous oxide reductase transcriptional regulator
VSRRAAPIAVILVGLSWTGAAFVGGRRPEPDLRPFLHRAFPGAKVESTSPGIFTARRGPDLLGHASAGTGDGYSGPVSVAVATGPEGRIRALALLEHRDTPSIVRSGLPLLRSLLGKSPDEPFRVGDDVDAVSGATQTSVGLALAARAGVRAIAEGALAQSAGEDQRVVFGPPEGVLLALLLIAAIGKNHPRVPARSRRLLRVTALLGGLVALGFLFARPWVIAFPIRLLSGDWPSWRTHLYWYVLLASTAMTFSRSGKSVYCPWICPFGAAQDVLGMVGGGHRRHLPRPLLFAWVKGALLWLAVLLGLVYRNPAPASYEVFGAFFRLSGTRPQFVVLGVVLLVAAFYSRPFCHWVCPVDAGERVLRPIRRSLARRGRPAALAPRTLRVLHPSAPPSASVFGRLREGLLVTAGLLCAALVVAHLAASVPDGGGGDESGLVGATFVSGEAPR